MEELFSCQQSKPRLSVRSILLLVLLLSLDCSWARPELSVSAAETSITLPPGGVIERRFGAAGFRIEVEENLARVKVSILFNRLVIKQLSFSPEKSTARFDVVDGKKSLRGYLHTEFAATGRPSFLRGDFQFKHKNTLYPFRGDLASWIWNKNVVWKQQRTWLTAEIRVEASIFMDLNQTVKVNFFAAEQPLTSVSLLTGVNQVVVDQKFQVGNAIIKKGMRLNLQPATAKQNGVVTLHGKFSSTNSPQVDFSGAILIWPPAPLAHLMTIRKQGVHLDGSNNDTGIQKDRR